MDDLLRIGDAAAQQQQLRMGRRERERQFVVQSTVRVAEHLVFVHDEQGRALAGDEPVLLRFQRGHEDGRAEIFRQIASGDADRPAAPAPLGEFIVRQRTSRDGVNRLAARLARMGP